MKYTLQQLHGMILPMVQSPIEDDGAALTVALVEIIRQDRLDTAARLKEAGIPIVRVLEGRAETADAAEAQDAPSA